MKNVGFHGGHTIYETGHVSDMISFFKCISIYAKGVENIELINERLYRRYLKQDQLSESAILMDSIKKIFSNVELNLINIDAISIDKKTTSLDLQSSSLDVLFHKYFESFHNAKAAAESFFDTFKIYQPVIIAISDLPWFIEDKTRSLDKYEELNITSTPYWLR